MFHKNILFIASIIASLVMLSTTLWARTTETTTSTKKPQTDANIFGHVTCNGKHLPYAVIRVVGTTIAAITDATGHYNIINLPVGTHTVEASMLGYTTKRKTVTLEEGKSAELSFELEEDYMQMDAVVVTGDKRAVTRRETGSIISSITPKLLSSVSASTVSEGISFAPGVRMENDCQNCGFNQVRLNGMPGQYSQILIDGRPMFGSVMGVYGMELIPSNMIERIEILRGGGSSLYGSSAVAGSINLILRDPAFNTFEIDYMQGFTGVGVKGTGGVKPDYNVNLSASMLTPDSKTGLSLYGSFRQRTPFDYDNDGFSELPLLRNTTIGARTFYRVTQRGKLSATYFHISEKRRGGNRFDSPLHCADVAEAPTHSINNASLQYQQYFRENDLLSINTSLLHVDRESYYGGNSLRDYGRTKNITYSAMAQYLTAFSDWGSLATGIDYSGEYLRDARPGYPTYGVQQNATTHEWEVNYDDITLTDETLVAHQQTYAVGLYGQFTYKHPFGSVTAGLRFDHFQVRNLAEQAKDKTTTYIGNAPVPRVSILFNLLPELQLRANYAMGYRAPQVYDEELHVGVSGAKRVTTRNSENLKHETSHSAMLSLDYNKTFQSWAIGCLVEGFYTYLKDAFINETVLENNFVYYTRHNIKSGANVYGANIELNYVPIRPLALKLGGTYQKSEYLETNKDLNEGQKDFLRAPNAYGFFMAQWKIWQGLALDATLNVTGPMKIAYEGSAARNSEEQDLIDNGKMPIRTTPTFFDASCKLSYSFRLASSELQFYTGVKNAFNSFQRDFDQGPERASSYVYGPMLPRTMYVGIKLGNIF